MKRKQISMPSLSAPIRGIPDSFGKAEMTMVADLKTRRMDSGTEELSFREPWQQKAKHFGCRIFWSRHRLYITLGTGERARAQISWT
jgi:hypothetical protein